MNPFSNNKYNLGADTEIGLTKEQVGYELVHSQHNTGKTCLICGNTAQYKLIPKRAELNTAQIQDKGFVCGHCLNLNDNINKNDYGIRELE